MSGLLAFFNYQEGELVTGHLALSKIVQAVGTPVYVYSQEAILSSFHELKKELQGIEHLICFAVKANSNISVLKLLRGAGAGADVVSSGELFRAHLAKIQGKKIVFSGVGKTSEEMTYALEYGGKGIFSFHVESIDELQVLNQVAQSLRKIAPVALRFSPDVNANTHPYIATGLRKNKFGMSHSEVLKAVERLRELPNLSLRGLSIHIGSQILSVLPLKDAFSRARDLLYEVNQLIGRSLAFLDLGGGIGITYRNEKTISIRQYCALIHQFFGKNSPLKSQLKILIEPGRLISGNAGTLITKVLYRKQREKKDFVIVDAAMNDLIRPALYGSYHKILPLLKKKGVFKKMDIVGPVCESADFFAMGEPLPKTIRAGDLLAILSTGAYGFVMASNYNSRPRVPEVLVHQGGFRVIRQREILQDLVRGEV